MRWSDEWRINGRCFGSRKLGDLFFADMNTKDWWQAKMICHLCPAQPDCREYALNTRQAAGIWGGLDEKERERMLRMKPERQKKFIKEVAFKVATYSNNQP